MKAEDFDALLEAGIKRRAGLHARKRADYASKEDVLSNFKRVSAAAAALEIDVSTPIGYNVFMELMKLDRKWNLIRRGVSPTNESLVDTIDDQITYACLSEGLLVDVKNEQDERLAALGSINAPTPIDTFARQYFDEHGESLGQSVISAYETMVKEKSHSPKFYQDNIVESPKEYREKKVIDALRLAGLDAHPAPKVFVAAPWEMRGYAATMMDRLRDAGAIITYDWTVNEVDPTSEYAQDDLGYLAERDIHGVLAADYLLAMPDGMYPCRGTWAEVGMSIATQELDNVHAIRVAIYPPSDAKDLLSLGCIYATLPGLTIVRTMDQVLYWLGLKAAP